MARASRDAIDIGSNPDGAVQQRPIRSICLRCRDDRETISADIRGGARLAQAVLQSGIKEAALDVRGVHCLSQCKRPCTVAISGPDRFTYLFGDLDPTCHAQDVVDLAALYVRSPNGFMARNDRPQAMRAGVLGRVPPLGWSGAAVETVTLTPPTLKEPRS
ncbi:MAG: DUF1636 domain-containing protein [Pseudomonadota bacterium]